MQRIVVTVMAAGLALAAFAARSVRAAGTYDPGASDTEIKIGNTWPYSGPASGTSPLARQMAGYFQRTNEQGGVNGRKIDFISLDDGYTPPKTLEDTRRLVEQDQVLVMFGQLGTPTNMAVRPYLNSRKVPQLFVTTGSNTLVDPKKYPWTMGFQPSYASEAIVFAKYILAERPNAKIGLLYQDDDFGSDHLDPFLATLGDKAKTMVVAKASYSVTDPTLDSQMTTLKGAGADTLYLITQGRAAPQAVTAARQRFGQDAMIFIPFVATAKSVIGPAGADNLKGVLSSDSAKDPTDPDLGRRSGREGLSRLGQEIHAGAGPGIERVEPHGLSLVRADGRGAEALRQRPDPRQRDEGGGEPQGRDHSAAAAGRDLEHQRRRLFPDAHLADEALRRHPLGAHRQADHGVKKVRPSTTPSLRSG